ncbi:MAG: response regulator [bacterium]|nr:response regulator [bacterium]
MEKFRILIVENETLIALHIKTILEARNYDVLDPAFSGEKAIERVKTEKPDLILMDILLDRGIDGIETAMRIQSEHDIPIIYLTASTDEKNLKRAQETKPYGYLIKPVKGYELYSTVETVLTKHKLEKMIRESEEFNSSLLNNSPNPVLVINPDMSIKYINPALAKLTGFTASDLINSSPPYPWWLEKENLQNTEYPGTVLGTGAKKTEKLFQKKYGEHFWVAITSVPLSQKEESTLLLENWVDITTSKQLKQEILDISEKERVRIGHDLHDGIGQDLTGIGFLFKVLMNKIVNKEFPEESEAQMIMDMIDQAKTHVRMLAKGLSPVNMEKNGIIIAVKELCLNTEKIFDITCTFDYNEELDIEDNTIATHTYHIIQESINNGVKHGKASCIIITMKKKGSKITLLIKDNGIGLKEHANTPKGLGLDLMKYRADIIGGMLSIEPRTSGGTVVTCIIEPE